MPAPMAMSVVATSRSLRVKRGMRSLLSQVVEKDYHAAKEECEQSHYGQHTSQAELPANITEQDNIACDDAADVQWSRNQYQRNTADKGGHKLVFVNAGQTNYPEAQKNQGEANSENAQGYLSDSIADVRNLL